MGTTSSGVVRIAALAVLVAQGAAPLRAGVQGPVRDWSSLDPGDAPGGLREGSRLGHSLAWDGAGERCWVGAPRGAAPLWRSGLIAGFRRSAGDLVLDECLRDPAGEPGAQLGWSLACGSAHLFAGAPLGSGAAPQSGVVLAFPLGGGAPQRLASPAGQTSDGFGTALAADGAGVWVGLPFARAPQGPFQAGRVERYGPPAAAGGGWILVQVVHPPFPLAHARFGECLAVQGDGLLVAAPFEPGGGALYRMGRAVERLAPEAEDAAEFGAGLAVQGNWVAVGAPGTAGGAGAVHLFRWTGAGWCSEGLLRGGPAPGRFGAALAFSGQRLLVGAPNADGGRVFVYRRSAQGWLLEAQERVSGSHGFGAAIAPGPGSGEELLVGAPAALVSGAPGGQATGPAGLPAAALPSAWWASLDPAKEPGRAPPR